MQVTTAAGRNKAIEDKWTARFMRRANGRIRQKDARALDISVRCASDMLEHRDFSATFKDAKKYGPASLAEFAQWCRDRYFHYYRGLAPLTSTVACPTCDGAGTCMLCDDNGMVEAAQ